MADPREAVERLRRMSPGPHPILSVYVNVPADPGSARSAVSALKTMLEPLRLSAAQLDHDAAECLRADIDAILDDEDRISGLLGRSLAFFRCRDAGLIEEIELPGRVPDAAVANPLPYVRPLDAQLADNLRACVVIVDKRLARILEMDASRIEQCGEVEGVFLRDANHGGWYGLDEFTTRQRAGEQAKRQHRRIVEAIDRLHRERGFDTILLGGRHGAADELRPYLTPHLEALVAGAFVVDPSAATPSAIREACAPIVEDWRRGLERRVLDAILSGLHRAASTIGLPRVVEAANRGAVDTLMLDRDASAPGGVCDSCNWIALDGDDCAVCGRPLRKSIDIFDALARSVTASGGTVRHVVTPDPLREHLVGALLRFPVPS